MFRMLRMPSESIWKDPALSERLARYRAICKGKKIARYLIAKKTPAYFTENVQDDVEEIWKTHNEARDEFNRILNEVDNEKLNLLDLKTPMEDSITGCYLTENHSS